MKLSKPSFVLITIALVGILIFMITKFESARNINSLFQVNQKKTTIPTQEIFFLKVIGATDINSGITMESMHVVQHSKTLSEQVIFSFSVLNHSNEKILFKNKCFGVRYFSLNGEPLSWVEIQAKYKIGEEMIYIPSHLEKYDFQINNSCAIYGEDFDVGKYRNIRIYISGVGEDSGKIYGAYLDTDINLLNGISP
jgi:hypothetical protein